MKLVNSHNEYLVRNNQMKHDKKNNNVCYAFNSSSHNPSFTSADPTKTFEKLISGKDIIYKNANNIVESIDKILSNTDSSLQKGFLASNLQKAGLSIGDNEDLILKNRTLLGDIFTTLKYPFIDMPFDLINSFCKFLKKTPLSSVGNKIQNIGFIKDNIGRVEKEKTYELVSNIFEQYCKKDSGTIDKYGNIFRQESAGKITKIAKNYATRDERTLNRLVTGTVGALFSSFDMHNISMLEKNDKEAAEKAQKDRFDQEMTRIGISAGLTFLSLGALNRYTKGSTIGSAIVVAGSTLIAEVVSRIKKHKSLIPLTPEQAAKIAQKHNKNKKQEAASNSVQNTFIRINKKDTANLYKDFTQNEINTYTANNNDTKTEEVKSQDAKNQKKKHGILFKVLAATAIACAIYVYGRYSKGELKTKLDAKKLYEQNKELFDKFINEKSGSLSKDLIKEIDDLGKDQKVSPIIKFLENIKTKITKKEVSIKVSDIEKNLKVLKDDSSANEIKEILETYLNHIKTLGEKEITNFTSKVDRPFIGAVCAGFTKIFKTIYSILSLPANFVYNVIFYKSDKAIESIKQELSYQDPLRNVDKYKNEITELSNIFKKYSKKQNCNEKIVKHIQKHTRNFEQGSETSDLANLSRTLVTLLSSYFYVNDFRNTVLIESEGKNTQRAQEVTNDAISYKVANFFFNGTLMNLANNIFKGPLNNSLLGATIIPTCTEFLNEFLIRTTIARPMKPLNSREEIIEYETSRANRKGPMGAWTRFYKKATGQKSLIEKYNARKTKKN